MDIVIKKTKDLKSALKIAESSKVYFETGFNNLKKDLNTHILFAAYVNNDMVGFIALKENNPEVVEISWMVMLPNFRSKGIGGMLVLQSLDELGGNYKICEVKTLADTHQDPGYAKTRNFYKKLGFVPLEIISPYPGWGDDNPCQIFVKSLK